MGRTLHFQVLNPDQLSDEHLNAMLAVSKEYNTGKFAGVWTCENFHLDPLSSYPNWQAGQNWKTYERRYGELEAEGLSRSRSAAGSFKKASPNGTPTSSGALPRSAATSSMRSSSTPPC
jgi:hypothetical protein